MNRLKSYLFDLFILELLSGYGLSNGLKINSCGTSLIFDGKVLLNDQGY